MANREELADLTEPEQPAEWRQWTEHRLRRVAGELLRDRQTEWVGDSYGWGSPEDIPKLSGPWDTWIVGPLRRPLITGTVTDWLAARPAAQAALTKSSTWVERRSVPGSDFVVFQLHEGTVELLQVWHWRARKRGTAGAVGFEGIWRPGWPKTKFSYQGLDEVPRSARDTLLHELMAFQEAPSRVGRHRLAPDTQWEARFARSVRDVILDFRGEGVLITSVRTRLSLSEGQYLLRLKRNGYRPERVQDYLRDCVGDYLDRGPAPTSTSRRWKPGPRLANYRD